MVFLTGWVLLHLLGSYLAVGSVKKTLHLSVQGDQCTAALDGEERLTISIPEAIRGDGIGLYVYHPLEYRAEPQYFKNIDIKPLYEAPFAHHFTSSLSGDTKDMAPFVGVEQWAVRKEKGIVHHTGVIMERAVLLLTPRYSGDFELRLDLENPIDAGIMVRAKDSGNGLVFTVRQFTNDAFFFPLVNGKPGPILGIMPMGTLTVRTEAGRLLSVLASVGIRCTLLLLVLLYAVRWIPALRVSPFLPVRFAPLRWTLPILTLLGASAVMIMAGIAAGSLDRIPHIADETAYLFQARIFAINRLWVPVPELTDFFSHPHIVMLGSKWYSKYPPMWSLLLSLGVRINLHWIVNPLLGGITSVLIFLTAKELGGMRAGLLAWVLAVSSPFFTIMGANMMSHMTAAMFTTGFFLFIIYGRKQERYSWFLLAGGCLGGGLITRPYTAFLVAIPGGIYLAYAWIVAADRKRWARLLLAFAVGLYPFLLIYFPWNVIHGDGTGTIPISLYGQYDDNDQLGFGPDKGAGWLKTWGTWGHTPAKALRSLTRFLDHTSDYLFGWPGRLSLCFMMLPLFVRRARAEVYLLLSAFLMLVLGHMLYWATQHIGYGARYWFSGVPGLIILSALGVSGLMEEPADATNEPPGEPTLRSPVSLLPLILLIAFIVYNVAFSLPSFLHAGHDYGVITNRLEQRVASLPDEPALVFVQTQGLLFNDGFFMNDPLLRGTRIFARDLGPRNPELMKKYPAFKAYTWDKTELRPLPPPVQPTGVEL